MSQFIWWQWAMVLAILCLGVVSIYAAYQWRPNFLFSVLSEDDDWSGGDGGGDEPPPVSPEPNDGGHGVDAPDHTPDDFDRFLRETLEAYEGAGA